MELIADFIDVLMHLDRHLQAIIHAYGVWTYGILFLIIFCETGLVVTPILPGDSLLFAAGAIAAGGSLDVAWLFGILSVAAVAGDTVNYQIGLYLGPKALYKENARVLKKEYLDRTHRFYDRYGGKTIVIARFFPIVRTFAPFLAGVGRMSYWRFAQYNVVGGLVWIATFVFGGYYFGSIPIIKRNFTLVILAIIVISVIPAAMEFLRRHSHPS
jgi:membrane-associated protein